MCDMNSYYTYIRYVLAKLILDICDVNLEVINAQKLHLDVQEEAKTNMHTDHDL